MKVLCIGEALIDMICMDKNTALPDGVHFLAKPGGAPANVAAVIAALGGEVELAAKVGNDAFGSKLINTLQEFGVSTKWMIESPEHFTTMAFVSLMENGERDFVFNRGADGQLTKEEIKVITLDKVSIVHFGSATAFLPGPLQEAYYGLLERALQKNIFISFDPNYRHLLFKERKDSFISHTWKFLSGCHFCKLSDEEAILVTGCTTAEEAIADISQKTDAVIAVTTGSRGALIRLHKNIITVPSFPVNPVDTTGAGDAFVGAVLFQLSNKTRQEITMSGIEQWNTIISNANKVGAKTCEYYGAMEAFRELGLHSLK